MVPQAYVYPAEMRATRDLLRRRTPLRRKRAELFAPVQNTNSQYTLPEIGKKIAYKANREGVAERCDDPAVQKTMAIDLELITSYDQMRSDLARFILKTAKQHDAQTLYLLQTVPGIGNILRLVLLDDMHQIDRFPRGQDCRVILSTHHVCESIRRETCGHCWEHRLAPPTSHGPLLKRPHSSCAGTSLGKSLWPRLEKKPDKGKALQYPGAHTRPGGLCHAQAHNSFRSGAVPTHRREQSGCARRRTRH